ncbi:MAG: YdeI/OmpD-associated family protein [Patescibacteria group bacterium]|nr:YdeI/OmpD-associated family protein [Patescibacteria group bacterium]
MSEPKTLYVANRKNWRKWLKKNFNKEKEIWLVYPKKSSGKEKILYNNAVEEALCFGWIDSTIKSLNKDSSIQRFSPRNPKSTYSQQNKERMKWLLKNDMIHASVFEKAKEIASEKFVFPKDIVNAIRKEEVVWKNYKAFSDTYKRIRIAYIDSARERPEEFKKRLNNFLNKTKINKQIGFGGIEKYY